jgi:hypothetical protein
MFKSTPAQNIKVGDIRRVSDDQKRKSILYYYRAEVVFVGEKSEAIYNPFDNQYVGTKVTNCVEIVWTPLNYEGDSKPFTERYHPTTTLDIGVDVVDVDSLPQEEYFEEDVE